MHNVFYMSMNYLNPYHAQRVGLRFVKAIEMQNHHTSLQKESLNMGKKDLFVSENNGIMGGGHYD
jgi:hypothetical protein